jgi:hypothetical protein
LGGAGPFLPIRSVMSTNEWRELARGDMRGRMKVF